MKWFHKYHMLNIRWYFYAISCAFCINDYQWKYDISIFDQLEEYPLVM